MTTQTEAIESLLAEYDMINSAFAKDLREALAEQSASTATSVDVRLAQQEPVAMRDAIVVNLVREGINKHLARELADHFIGLATPQPPAQPAREWVGLTRMELIKCGVLPFGVSYELYQAIEAKLKEKNT